MCQTRQWKRVRSQDWGTVGHKATQATRRCLGFYRYDVQGKKIKKRKYSFWELDKPKKSSKVQPIKQNLLFIVAGRQHQALFQVLDFCHKAFIVTMSVQFGHSQTMMHKKSSGQAGKHNSSDLPHLEEPLLSQLVRFLNKRERQAGNSLG